MANGRFLGFVFAVILLLGSAGAGRAGTATPLDVQATEEDGFGRLVFAWPRKEGEGRVPKHRETMAAGVLVLMFDEPVGVDIDHILSRMPRYFALIRQDPDQRTLRFAMKTNFSLNVMEAGHELYVDLLPPNWRAAPPPLPDETVARLKAEEVLRAAKVEKEKATAKQAEREAKLQLLELRVGEHDNFSRLVFSWGQPVLYSVVREADSVTLTFDRAVDLSLAQLRVDPPPFIKGARSQVVDGRLVVQIETEPGMTTRDFREDLNIVLDVGPVRQAGAMGRTAKNQSGQGQKPDKPVVEQPVEQALPDGVMVPEDVPGEMAAEAPEPASKLAPDSGPEKTAPVATQPPEPVASKPLKVEPSEQSEKMAVAADVPAEKQRTGQAPALTPAPALAGSPEMRSDELPAREADEKPQDILPAETGDEHPKMADASPDGQGVPDGPLLVETELMGNSVRLTFPWTEHVATAVFERAGYLWVVFDRATAFELSEISEEVRAVIGEPSVMEMATGSALRFALPRRSLITVSEKDTRWVVMVGDVLLEQEAPVTVERTWTESGEARVKIALEGAAPVRWIKDPVVQDMIAVVTAPGPIRGLLTPYRFVEFEALATAQGLAFVPLADDLLVHVSQDIVSVSRQRGLLLSSGADANGAGNLIIPDPRRLAFMDFPLWRGAPDDSFTQTRQSFLYRLASAGEEELQGVRLDYAKYLLARDLAPEALTVMRLVEQDQANIAFNPGFRALRGVMRYMAGHADAAVADLAVRGLERDRHAAFWRAMVYAELDNWRSASADFELGETVVEMYEPDLQARFRVKAAETALAVSELEVVAFQLDEIPESATDPEWLREADLIRAAMLERQNKSAEALEIYDRLADDPDRRTAMRARYARASAMHIMGALSDEDMIVALDRLRFMWRGDELELMVLARLGRLEVAHGDIGEGLKTMRTAVSLYHETELGRQLASEMTDIFANLFIDGGADKMAPVKALSLYYDFRELTPIGQRGDEMIRHLADRLVTVDLLEQAAELLQHQVSHRLRGVARAQVATRLAAIYLMDGKANDALTAIRSSRQTLLPRPMVEARHLIEARALSQLKLFDNALDLISDMSGEDVETTRADILWAGQRWIEAGGQIEGMLGDSWSKQEALDDEARFQVMRGVVAYTLAGDESGVRRMRSKFGGLMRKSPDADSFTILTEPAEWQNVQVGEVTRAIADVDTLDRFLKKFRDGYQTPQDDAPETAIN